MEREVVEAWDFQTAQELQDYLNQALMLAKAEGHSADTVYAENKRRMTLVRERLTDGSHVMNLLFFDGEAACGFPGAVEGVRAMSELTKDLVAADLPEILAQFLNGDMPLVLAKRYFASIEGNDIGDFDVRLADGRLFRAFFEEAEDE